MKICNVAPLHNFSAITTYRLLDWSKVLAGRHEEVEVITDDYHPLVSHRLRAQQWYDSDIVNYHAASIGPNGPLPRDYSRIHPNYYEEKGVRKLKFPPSMVMDMDDTYDLVHYTNPAYAVWGVKDSDGNILNPGDSVKMKFTDDEEEKVIKDGDEVNVYGQPFILKENWARHAVLKKTMETLEGLTVSTPYLEKYYRDEFGIKNVFVKGNGYNFKELQTVVPIPNPAEIRILWTGGSSHTIDIKTIIEPLNEVLKKFKNVKFMVYGQEFPWLSKQLPEGRFEYISWTDPRLYMLKLSSIGHDINLIPLAEEEFNRGKSGIKWYENSIIGRPAATLAKNWDPYREIEEGKTGMLYNTPQELVEKLTFLIENAGARREMAEEAKVWVRKNKDLENMVDGLLDFYKAIRKEHILIMMRNLDDGNPAAGTFESHVVAGQR